jgi:hypothetical protein
MRQFNKQQALGHAEKEKMPGLSRIHLNNTSRQASLQEIVHSGLVHSKGGLCRLPLCRCKYRLHESLCKHKGQNYTECHCLLIMSPAINFAALRKRSTNG